MDPSQTVAPRFQKIEGGLYLGPQPSRQDLEDARRHGVRTVIDLRAPAETVTPNGALVTTAGLDYVNVPVNKAALSQGLIDRLDEVMQQKQGPFLMHCATGARAAMLVALRKAQQNRWNAERTLDEAALMGFDLRATPDFASFIKVAADN